MELLKKHKHLFYILLFAFVLRLVCMQIPIVENMNPSTRQALTATCARNFYYNGFNFFKPQLDNNGNDNSLYLVGAPVYSYLCALGYLVFKPNTWWPRLVSVIFSLGTIFFLYHLILLFYKKRSALIAVFIFAISPMSVAVSRSIQPDALMVFCIVASLYFLARFFENTRYLYLLLFSLSLIVGIGAKIYTVYLVLPLGYLLWQKYGKDVFKHVAFWAVLVSVGVSLSWYVYVYYLAKTNPTIIYNVFVGNREFYGFISNILTKSFFVNVSRSFIVYVMTPLGALLAFWGLIKKKEQDESLLFYFWLLGLLGYLILFSGPNMNHHYYQYPFLPVLAFFAAQGIETIRQSNVFSFTYLNNKIGLAILAITVFLTLALPYKNIYTIPPAAKSIVPAGEKVKAITPKDSLVIASFSSGPVFLYYCDRKGWDFLIHREKLAAAYQEQNATIPDNVNLSPIMQLEGLRRKGAQYFASANMGEFNTHPEFSRYMYRHYRLLAHEKDKYIIFDIRSKKV
jgi:4-amino-4-deoxy-L-arabinose transferase-like glycosyltransferase